MKKATNDAEQALATKIARQIFTYGSGKFAVHATRLQLMLAATQGQPERALGGWCEAAVRDVIADLLRAAARKKGA